MPAADPTGDCARQPASALRRRSGERRAICRVGAAEVHGVRPPPYPGTQCRLDPAPRRSAARRRRTRGRPVAAVRPRHARREPIRNDRNRPHLRRLLSADEGSHTARRHRRDPARGPPGGPGFRCALRARTHRTPEGCGETAPGLPTESAGAISWELSLTSRAADRYNTSRAGR
jgi:hypothetical protein